VTQLAPHSSAQPPSPRRSRRAAEARHESVAQLQAQRPAHGGTRRGRHATTYGQGFGWVVTWTVLGSLVPGTGLLAAGRRIAGSAVLSVVALSGVAVAGALLVAGPQRLLVRLLDRGTLLWAAIALGLLALAWVTVILTTHVALRRGADLTGGQRMASAALVTALVTGISLPIAQGGNYALITRDLLGSLFKNGQQSEPTGQRPDTSGGKSDPWAAIPRVNVLLIGSDAGSDRQGVRADSVIVASIDTKTGETVLISLPRNLEKVPFPLGSAPSEAFPQGFDWASDPKLNAVWTWAQENAARYFPGDPQPGLTATRLAVEGATGLKIDQYALLDLRGFQSVVDAVGGVTVNITERLPIGGSSERPVASSWLEPGPNQHLDGYHALWFARSRWSTDDYDRMRRQRCVIAALAAQVDPLTVVKAYPRLAASAKSNMETDIPLQDLQAWADLALRVKGAHVRSLPFTDQVVPDRANPDFVRIHALIQQALRPPSATVATPSTTAGTGSTGTAKPSPTATQDPTQAQDVTEVC
jgi:LCP family protein required for cell wall assembly